ncbi:hypothetical protein IHN32_07960 [Deinococcus sp. 14RED07]|uniref:hypothetical protein n=1 Tax=unclassified Deinococcus TaxID=2623546 RepID=UPI001E4EB33B|nr:MULTISPECIES: hypothetical protein [unclassified Deinococcus]MCD0158314.1 hypothetical protein [Deinococcus sp. 6GRE01]MCD0175877.1 hypothetical protein [Deinococcus sp. 14RED07]
MDVRGGETGPSAVMFILLNLLALIGLVLWLWSDGLRREAGWMALLVLGCLLLLADQLGWV